MSDIGLVSPHPLQEKSAARGRAAKSELGRFSGWYGVWCIIATEGSLFAYLFFSYSYALVQSPQHWPLDGPPALPLPVLTTVLLLASSAALAFSQWLVWQPARGKQAGYGLAAAFLCAIAALALQCYDFQLKAPLLSRTAYDSYYALIAGLDILHAAAGVIALAGLLLWFHQDLIIGLRRSYVAIIAAYWHFTVVIWLCVFAIFIAQPHMR